jgi:hypothetical protein
MSRGKIEVDDDRKWAASKRAAHFYALDTWLLMTQPNLSLR